jgi:hypothetical protein
MTPEEEKTDLALKQYNSILNYFLYESNIFWTRSTHFLTAHTFLLGFVLTQLPFSNKQLTWARIFVLAFTSIGGILLSNLWMRTWQSGRYWISHWTDLLREIEQNAHGSLLVIREFPKRVGYVSSTLTNRNVIILFVVLWALVLGYLCFCAFLRCHDWLLV